MKTKTKKAPNKKNIKKEEEKKTQENKNILEEKDKKKKKPGVRLLKCEYCQNVIPDPKKTLNFSCQHQLCGVCISHSIFRDYFKSITERSDLVTLHCNECLKRKSLEPGWAQVQLSFILNVLKDTYKIRNKKQRDICLKHNNEADFCIECKRWICEECKVEFHKSNFPSHSVFTTEEPFSFKKCLKHSDRGLELFCDDCGIEICPTCALKGGEHSGHNVLSMFELKKRIVKGKKKYKFQNMDEFDYYLQQMQIDFKNKFEESYKQKSDLISEITTILQNFYDKFFSFKEKMESFIENYFKIIRACYFNYFKDIEEKEPRMNSIEFINSIDKEISHFDFDSKYTEELQKIKENLELIIPRKFFEYKLRFANHSFKCVNVIKDIIEEKKDVNEDLKGKKIKDTQNQIYCLTQLQDGNILTGGSKGLLTIWDLNTGKKVDSFKAHKGNIFSVIELSDGRLVSAGCDSWIKIWNPKNELDNDIEMKIVDLLPKKSVEKELKPEPEKEKEQIPTQVNKEPIIQNNQTNNNVNNNIIEIKTTSEIPINKNNETTTLNKPLFDQHDLNFVPKNIKIPGNENLGSNTGMNNTGMNILNNTSNINPELLNQPQIKVDPNAPDIKYGGDGVYEQYPPNVGYGSSGIKQTDIQNTQINPENNMNNNNVNNTNNVNINNQIPNTGNEVSKQNNNENNVPLLQDSGFNNNVTNPVVNNENNNINQVNVNNTIPSQNPINVENTQINLAKNNNISNPPLSSEPKPEEKKQEEKKPEDPKPEEKKEENKEEEKYNDFFDDVQEKDLNQPKANPPKKPDSLNEESNNIIEAQNNNYSCKLKLHGHPDDVNCIFETSQKQIISCGKDGYILIWSLKDPEKPLKIKGHNNGVGCGIELKDNFIITGGGDFRIKIWDISIEDLQKPDIILKGHTNAIFSICRINEKKLASASCDKSIRIWDLNYYICTQVFEGHAGFIWSLVNIERLVKDSNAKNKNKDIKENNKEEIKNLLVSASSDRTIKFWDVEEKRCIKTILAHDKEITTLGKLKDGNIISGSLDSTIKIWKI